MQYKPVKSDNITRRMTFMPTKSFSPDRIQVPSDRLQVVQLADYVSMQSRAADNAVETSSRTMFLPTALWCLHKTAVTFLVVVRAEML